MHFIPGLVKLDNGFKNSKWAKFPYYDESKKHISQADEVLAFAVLVAECLLADCYQWRETWKAIVSHPPSFKGCPKKLLCSLI